MRLSKNKRDTQSQMNMTPMIDVVFLLLIFFMTVSQVSKVDKVQLQLPELKGTEEQRPVELTINVQQNGDIVTAGEIVTELRLISLLSQMLPQVGNDPNRLKVVVRADKRSKSRSVNIVVKALGQLQITRVRIAVQNQG